MLDELADHVEVRTAKGVAQALSRMASSGQAPPGTRLPTVRALALRLGISPATVSEAWQLLAVRGLVRTDGRRGSFIGEGPALEPVRRFRHVTGSDLPLDLSTGYPDPDLLPDLRPFLSLAADAEAYTGYPDREVDPRLDAELRAVLPPSTRARMLATDTLAAMAELLPVLTGYGDRVIVPQAHFAPDLDLLDRFGLIPVPVPLDDDGPDPVAVAAALDAGARVLLLQPRAHNPTGIVTSPARLQQLAHACAACGTWVVENDYFGNLASSDDVSASTWAPERTVHLRSFAKELHPDLRVCVIAGPDEILQPVRRRRVGGSWISRINQDVLRLMLQTPAVGEMVRRARDEYGRRRTEFVTALAGHGVHVASRDGLNIWVPVLSERAALVSLAARGVSVAPGSAFTVDDRIGEHLRLSIAQLSGEIAPVAALVAAAASSRFSSRIGSGG